MNYEFVGTLATIIIASVAVIGLILRMDSRITAQGEQLNQRIDDLARDVNGRIDVLNGRIDALSSRVDALSERVSRIEGLLEGYFIRERTDGSPPPQA